MRKVIALLFMFVLVLGCKSMAKKAGVSDLGDTSLLVADTEDFGPFTASDLKTLLGLASKLKDIQPSKKGVVYKVMANGKDFYAGGGIDKGDYIMQAVYWKNGQMIDLGVKGLVMDIIVADGRLIMCGRCYEPAKDIFYACYWVDGKLRILPGDAGIANALDYTMGKMVIVGDNNGYGCYWINDVFFQLPYWGSHAGDVIADSGSIYICGALQSSACWWKDAKISYLNKGLETTSINKTENSFVITGITKEGSYGKGAFWIDGKLTELKEGSVNASAPSGAVLYLCGTQINSSSGKPEGQVWKDSSAYPLAGISSIPSAMILFMGVPVCGGITSTDMKADVPAIWIGTKRYFLPTEPLGTL